MEPEDLAEHMVISPKANSDVYKVVTIHEDHARVVSQCGVFTNLPFSTVREAFAEARPESPRFWRNNETGQIVERLQLITTDYVVRGNEFNLYRFAIRPTPRWGRKDLLLGWPGLTKDWEPYWHERVEVADFYGLRDFDEELRRASRQ